MSFKENFKKLITKLKSKTVITILGFTCLALLIWFGGPLIAIAGYEPLISISARIILLLIIIIIWGAIKFTSKVKDKKQSEEMVNNLINGEEGSAESSTDETVKTEIDVLHKKMLQALDILKATKFANSKNIYELPWYIMIGPPGSGKTTAIQHSGLEYPLKEKMGIDMIQGVGGTRHCDWWFTNKAVLIDTAGRYTTQDSHAKQDSRAWQGFLGLLKKFRPLRPINGVIISMGMSELLNQTKTERNLHARAIKQRLQELQNQLGMTFPVYVLFSKSDLIAGFNEFFDDFAKEDCEQIWGVTFPLTIDNEQESIVSTFNKEFHTLLSNLNARINARLKNERDLDRRAAIYEFPKQLRLLQGAADDFLKEIFSPNAYEEAPLLRGVYLTSATQEGTPIDHLSSTLAGGKAQLKSSEVKHQRSYFIKRLLEDVIFPEKNLASVNRQHDKQNLLLRRATVAVASVVTVFFIYGWWSSYSWNTELVDQTKEALVTYEEVTAGGLTEQSEIITLTKGLSTLRNFPVGYANEESEDAKTLGLYQGNKLKQPAKAAYERALDAYLLPYLTKALTQEMSDNSLHLNYVYETLKTYLMLYNPEYYQEDDIKIWFSAYFDRNIPGKINTSIRNELNQHLSTLLAKGTRGSEYNEEAVLEARRTLTMLPLVERAYQRLKSDFIDSSIPDFKLIDILSLDSLQGFTFQSGRSFNDGIPSLYTYNGFHGIFSIEKNRIIKRLIEDSWVYGDDLNTLDDATKSQITAQLEQKYIRDYIFYWEDFLSDLTVKPMNSLDEGADVTRALSSSDAPIKSIIAAAQKNVQLTKIPLSKNGKAAAEIAKSTTDVLFASKKSRISRLLPDEPLELEIDLPGQEVELAFTDLIAVDIKQLDDIQGTLRLINRSIGKIALSSRQNSTYMNQRLENEFASLGSDLQKQISDMPFPVAGWLEPIAKRTKGFAQTNQSQRLNSIWKSQVLAEYRRAISGRYPFKRSANREVRIKDFSRFFAHGGTLDKFWKQYLADYVDTSKESWHFTKDIGISNKILAMYQRANVIREAFFESDTKLPKIDFSLEAQYLDRNVSQFMLEIDGQQLNYRHGPTRKEQFVWPGESANNETRIAFTPPNGGRPLNKKYAGEWSLFKFFDDLSRARPETKNDGLLKISLSGYNANVMLIANSVNNPFWMVNLESFSCPTTL